MGAMAVSVHGPLGEVVREKAAQTGELVVAAGASGDLKSTRPSVRDVTRRLSWLAPDHFDLRDLDGFVAGLEVSFDLAQDLAIADPKPKTRTPN